MAQQYCRTLLRVAVAQICQNFGWSSAQSSSLEVLTDVLERYLMQLGITCSKYTQHYGRKQPTLDDVALTFQQMGISLAELEDYVRHVEPVPFAHEVVAFPAPKSTDLSFPNPRSREVLQHREEHIPDYMPYMFPNMKDEIPEEKNSPIMNGTESPVKSEGVGSEIEKDEAGVGEKQAMPSSTPEMPPSKRPRFGNLPEEAGHSQYEMSSVFMGPNGVLTTRQGCVGRMPEPCMPPPNPRSLAAGANKENSGKTKDSAGGPKISISVGGIGADGLGSGKSEGRKGKKVVHKKNMHHDQTAKGGAEVSGKEIGKKSASSKAAAKFLKKLKQSKKSGKLFAKSKSKDKSSENPREMEVLHEKTTTVSDQSKRKKEKKSLPLDSDEELRNLSSPKSSREASPDHSIIHDGEGGAEKKAQLEAINDSINAVLRDGPVKDSKGKKKKKKDDKLEENSTKGESSTKNTSSGKSQEKKRKPGRPPKVQKGPEPPPAVDMKPFVSDKYTSEELQVYEFNDSPPDTSVKARRPSEAEPPLPPPPAPAPTVKQEHHPKHSTSSHKVARRVEPEDDLFKPDIKIESHHDTSESKTSKADKEKSKLMRGDKKMRAGDEKRGHKAKEDKDKLKEKKEKIKNEKESSKEEKEKHKDKFKKDKKEKKKEKEKKKKHKEKDRGREKEKEKSREEKVKQETGESRESSPVVGVGVKLKIKIGGSAGPATSVMVTSESNPASPASTAGSKRESMSPPRTVPKLYISKKGPEEKTKKPSKQSQPGESKPKTSPLAVSAKSQSVSPSSSSKTSPSPRSTPTPPVPRKTPTPPPPSKVSGRASHSPHSKDSSTSRQKEASSPAPSKERQSRPITKDKGRRKEKKKERKRSLSSLSSLSSSSSASLSPSKPSKTKVQTPPKLKRASSSSPEKSPPSLPFQSSASPPSARATNRSPSYTSPPRSPTPPPSLSQRKITPPPALSPANAQQHQSRSRSRSHSRSPSPSKPPTPGSTSPPPSPDWNLPLSPTHHRSPTPTPRTPTASPSRNIMPSPTHSPVSSPLHRSPSPVVQQSSRPGSRLLTTPEPKSHPSPASSGKSSTSTSKPARTVEAETVCVFYDEAGQKVWICPACKHPDDGSNMIGCDMCDNWYHWPCVDINKEPEEPEWFCPKCLPKKKTSSRGRGRPRGRGRGRGRKKIT